MNGVIIAHRLVHRVFTETQLHNSGLQAEIQRVYDDVPPSCPHVPKGHSNHRLVCLFDPLPHSYYMLQYSSLGVGCHERHVMQSDHCSDAPSRLPLVCFSNTTPRSNWRTFIHQHPVQCVRPGTIGQLCRAFPATLGPPQSQCY